MYTMKSSLDKDGNLITSLMGICVEEKQNYQTFIKEKLFSNNKDELSLVKIRENWNRNFKFRNHIRSRLMNFGWYIVCVSLEKNLNWPRSVVLASAKLVLELGSKLPLLFTMNPSFG